jgi:hypothetical protein
VREFTEGEKLAATWGAGLKDPINGQVWASDIARLGKLIDTHRDTLRVQIVKRIIEDLRTRADDANRQSMVDGHSVELKHHYRLMHEKLRQIANIYESWAQTPKTEK